MAKYNMIINIILLIAAVLKFRQILQIILWQSGDNYKIELKDKIKDKMDGSKLIQIFKETRNPAYKENLLSKILDAISIGKLMAVMFLFYPFLSVQIYFKVIGSGILALTIGLKLISYLLHRYTYPRLDYLLLFDKKRLIDEVDIHKIEHSKIIQQYLWVYPASLILLILSFSVLYRNLMEHELIQLIYVSSNTKYILESIYLSVYTLVTIGYKVDYVYSVWQIVNVIQVLLGILLTITLVTSFSKNSGSD